MICLTKVAPKNKMWSCQQCRIVVHFKCITDWILKMNNSEITDHRKIPKHQLFNWACPHCQYQLTEPLPEYRCYCGKVKKPRADHFLEPHTCGKECGRQRAEHCTHPCTLKCHSGPCPPCNIVMADTKCYCGKEWLSKECSSANELSCSQVCGKALNCGKHTCELVCHSGDCGDCKVQEHKACHCGKLEKDIPCGTDFSCEQVCQKTIDCGNHKCGKTCHEGDCMKCDRIPQEKETCHCGAKLYEDIVGQKSKFED